MVKRIAILAALVSAACGSKPPPPPVPVLPSDGDAHVAKPPPPPEKPVVDDPWAGKTDMISPPAAQKPAKLELPAITELKLSNGLQVYAVKSDRLPVVSVQLAVRAGRMHEPRARLGVAEAAADMLVKGTKKHDAVGLAKAIDFVGGSISIDATYEATLLSCSALARNTQTCFDLMPEIVETPTFPIDELAKVKNTMIAAVRSRLDDANALAGVHVLNLLWGNDHVRGWINSETSVNALQRDDLVAWHKTWFVPNNAMLVVVGDIDPKQLKGQLERAFGGWKQAPVPPVPSYKEPGLSGIRIRLVDKPGQTQTHIRIAQFGIKHDDPRFFDTLVWNYALGGGAFSSRMMKSVRVAGGKTYGASSAFDRNLDKGSFVAQSFTRNSEAVATAKLILAEIGKMAKDGPTEEEVTQAISNIAGGYGMRFQGAADLGGAVVAAELHGFGSEYLQNYPLAVGHVDVASARAAAHEILDPRDYVMVMVGDAKDLEPQLKKEGWRYEKVAFTDPVSPEVKQTEAPVDPKAAAAMKKLLDEAVVAKGGRAKLSAIKSIKMTASGSTTIGGKSLPVEIERVFVLPDHMRIDADIAKQLKVIVAVAGKTGWIVAPDNSGQVKLGELGGQDMLGAQFEAWREPELILLKATDPAVHATPQPDAMIDGKPHAVVKLASPFGSLDVGIYIDKATKMVTRMTYSDQGQSQTDDFADYRTQNGIQIAFKRNSSNAGRSTSLDLKTVELDGKIDAKVFDKPADVPK